jgi:hypothetical protein
MESKFLWLLGGLAIGVFVAKSVRFGGGLSFTANANVGGRRPAGSGSTPLDQPTGTAPYEQVGAYNPYFGAGFPDLPDPDNAGRIIEGNSGGFIQ